MYTPSSSTFLHVLSLRPRGSKNVVTLGTQQLPIPWSHLSNTAMSMSRSSGNAVPTPSPGGVLPASAALGAGRLVNSLCIQISYMYIYIYVYCFGKSTYRSTHIHTHTHMNARVNACLCIHIHMCRYIYMIKYMKIINEYIYIYAYMRG